ncbi:MAG TPA: phenylacetate-CoA oxygenase subunit PaaJ [Thiolinea sp.]|nr:phenylacetate-CoA oxygenase subunit PaaJ [Thiolinea sp.]
MSKRVTIPMVTTVAWTQRLSHRRQSPTPALWELLDAVKDPEVPALSLWDLGVLRDIVQDDGGRIRVTISPTYSGCPALDVMRSDIISTLQQAGHAEVEVRTELSPAWSTEALSPQGHEQLRAYGIAPPRRCTGCSVPELTPETGIACPHCGSDNTRRISEFGSTACKALFQCQSCHEPFDYFKPI